MSKTTELNSHVFPYILEAIDSEVYGTETTTEKAKLEFLAVAFRKEYVFPDNLKRYGSYQNLFAEWLKGLPSCFNIDFENYKILQIAKSWGSIPKNATEKQMDKILENWFNFIAAKTFILFNRNKINSFYL